MTARRLALALALLGCQMAAGCQVAMADAEAPQATEASEGFFMGGEVRARAENDAAPPTKSAKQHDDGNREDASGVAAGERKMIHRGTVGIAVARPDDAIERFLAQVKGWGGYLAQRVDRQVTCRLPAARFDEALASLRTYGRVTHESIQADDVTKQYIDLGIRLDNAQRARDRLLALLEKATAVKDLLEIEGALRRLTEEIERMEGERKYLEDQVAMATLTAAFEAVAPANGRARAPASRFSWINRVGVEHVRRQF